MRQISQSALIDFLRWFSAFLVAIGHLRSAMFADFNITTSQSFVHKVFYFCTGFGHQAVVIFFVLSGYLVGGSVLKQFHEKKFNFLQYKINRISRLYTVFILALIITYLLDTLGHHLNSFLYTKENTITSLDINPVARLSIKNFLGNLFMLQTITVPVFGSNGPLWSLANEFWYYLIFPISVSLIYNRKNLLKAMFLIGILSFILYLLPLKIILYFSVWLAGLIPYFLSVKRKILIYPVIFFIIIILFSTRLYPNQYFLDIALGILIGCLLCFFDNPSTQEEKNINNLLASFSYSLYLLHYPLLLVLITYFGTIKTVLTLQSFILYLFILSICYLCSYILAYTTEFKTGKVRFLLSKYITKKQKHLQ